MASHAPITGAPTRAPLLLTAIRAFCTVNNMAESSFGRAAVRDPRLVADLRRGRELRPVTLLRVLDFMGVQ